MKLIRVLLEATQKPKAVIMAGGAGSGKSYLLKQLDLGGINTFNPDKYIEDPNSPAHNNLSAATAQTNKDVLQAIENKTSFVWDTTASNSSKVKDIIKAGYDVYMVMVYTHPMISYISNFQSRERNVPASAVFSTWRNVYQLISDYSKMTGGNLSIFINDRDGKYGKEIEAFNTAAKNGASGIADYLASYNKQNDIGASSFRKPIEMSKEDEQEFNKAAQGIDYDKGSYGEDRAIKNAFINAYQKNGAGPGADKLKDSIKKYRENRDKQNQREKEVLDNIGEMLFSSEFQELLKHSTPSEIDSAVQTFLT